jgi:hypothetical protein
VAGRAAPATRHLEERRPPESPHRGRPLAPALALAAPAALAAALAALAACAGTASHIGSGPIILSPLSATEWRRAADTPGVRARETHEQGGPAEWRTCRLASARLG